jgi:hypothetical protein
LLSQFIWTLVAVENAEKQIAGNTSFQLICQVSILFSNSPGMRLPPLSIQFLRERKRVSLPR